MKFRLIFLAFLISNGVFAQMDQQLWVTGGAKYAYTKKLDFAAHLNLRIEPIILNTFFTELTAKYEVTKWFKPSLDYRLVSDRNDFGNYHWTQRVNLNANFEKKWNRFEFGARVRLQSTLSRVRSPESSFSDIAPGVRIKPEILYDFDNSALSPNVSCEWFFGNDAYSGIYVSKVRAAIGLDFEMIGPYNVSLKYMYGQSLLKTKSEHIVSFSFTQKYKRKSKEKKN
ncbi:MAG: DUF2490 domain-containing protein [Crocinitomicaceae bacterium]